MGTHRMGRQWRTLASQAMYRSAVIVPMLGGAAVAVCTRCAWWAYGGLAAGLVVLATVPEPAPSGLPEPWPLVSWRELLELAAALEQAETTVTDETALEGLPLPLDPELTRGWLEDLAAWLEVRDLSTRDLARQLADMPSVVAS